MKTITHSENWWAEHPETPANVRCNAHYHDNKGRCRRVAEAGSVVCGQHGAAAGQTRRRAAERIIATADQAAFNLVEWMSDPKVEIRERVKIAQDMLDRGGLGAAQTHRLVVSESDPIEILFRAILADPEGLVAAPDRPALTAVVTAPGEVWDEGIVEAELVPIAPAPPATAPKTPKHIREALARLL